MVKGHGLNRYKSRHSGNYHSDATRLALQSAESLYTHRPLEFVQSRNSPCKAANWSQSPFAHNRALSGSTPCEGLIKPAPPSKLS